MYSEHRETFLEVLGERNAASIVFSGTHQTRNNDCDYRFRPDSDFVYVTGFNEPDCALVLLPHGEGTAECPRTILFLRERDPLMETWNGRRLGVERAPETLGVDLALPIGDLWDSLTELLVGYGTIIAPTGLDDDRDRKLLDVLSNLRNKVRGGTRAPASIEHPRDTLHELRLYKNENEVALIEKANSITLKAHHAAMALAADGRNECELDGEIIGTFMKNGGTGESYNNIVASGNNGTILHYGENNQVMRDGQMVLIDAGCEWNYYASDVTRTFPVSGKFTEPQRAIYQLVLDAMMASIDEVRPGVPFNVFHDTATRVLAQGLIDLGIVSGSLEEVLENRDFAKYTIHKTGHWLGLDVHDQGSYAGDDGPRAFEPGMITTVEPGLYFTEDDQDIDPKWRGIAVRIEDNILVTADGNRNLSDGIAKTIEDVEAVCAGQTAACV